MSHAAVGAVPESGALTNHPLSSRMCVIAFLSFNLSLGCMYGTFGVFVEAVEAKYGVARDLSSLGVALVMSGIALSSPFVGALAEKFSLRLVMMTGAAMCCLGYIVLALSPSIWLNLAAYALLFGPGLSMTGTLLPATLVTRWYNVNRGRALGLISMPVMIALLPPVAALLLNAYGLTFTYGALAAVTLLLVVTLSFVVDRQPGAAAALSAANAAGTDRGLPNTQLLRRGAFWALSLAAASITTGAIIFSAHEAPMGVGWGLTATQAATLLSAMSGVGIAGSLLLGWLSDRLGGTGTLALLCIGSAFMTALLMLKPPYIPFLAISGGIGLFTAAVIPAFSMALAQRYGEATFGRALGLGLLLALPFNLLGVPAVARAYMATGSYVGAMAGLAAFYLLCGLLTLMTRAAKVAPAVA